MLDKYVRQSTEWLSEKVADWEEKYRVDSGSEDGEGNPRKARDGDEIEEEADASRGGDVWMS